MSNTVTTNDTTKNVNKNSFYVRIFKDNTESSFNTFSISSTTYVKEVSRLKTCIFNKVHSCHCKTCTVYHTTNSTVKIYIVKTNFFSLNFNRILLTDITHICIFLLSVKCIVIKNNFSIYSHNFIIRCF